MDSLRPGGLERLVVAVHGRLPRHRFDLRVACLAEPAPLARELRDLKVTVHELGLRQGEVWRGVLSLRRLVATLGIDVVHTYGRRAGSLGRLAGAGKVPVVSTLPDPDDGEGEEGAKGRLPWLDRLSARRLSRRVLVTSLSSRVGWASLGVQADVVPLCVDVERLEGRLQRCDREQARRALGLGPEGMVFLHAARFESGRGHDRLLHGFRVALTERPRLRLLVAGDGSGLTRARSLAEELDLQDAVVFLGEVADMVPLYRACDAFVLPGRADGRSSALLEAMTAAMPAVVGVDGGEPEIATRETAILVEADRVEQLARALLSLERDPDLRQRLGIEGRRRAAAFDAAAVSAKLEEIYTALA